MSYYDYQVGYESMRVDGRWAVALADNGEQADAWVGLKAAPAICEPGLVALYIATNGDPIQICTLNKEGGVIWFLGEDEPEDTEEITIATCLEGFAYFAGRNPAACADWCAILFGAYCERR